MSAVKVRCRTRTSWRAKLHKPTLPKLVQVPDGMEKRLGHGMMLVPTALEVDGMIARFRAVSQHTCANPPAPGHWHDADLTCPLATGIFLRIVAEAAEEDRLAGKPEITPYWRLVRDSDRVNAKFPAGVER